MNEDILPKCHNPLIFADFLISAYELVKQDVNNFDISVHALTALFHLLTTNGLDYPEYYTHLYSFLLQLPQIFNLSEKSKFLKLLEISLKSPKVSSSIVASFIK